MSASAGTPTRHVYTLRQELWKDIRDQLMAECRDEGFTIGKGLPYLYGIYKSKKRSWRPIAGVCALGNPSSKPCPTPSDGPARAALPSGQMPDTPQHPLGDVLDTLTDLLNVVLQTQQEIDEERQATTGLRAFEVIASPQHFAPCVKVHLKNLEAKTMRTVDFKNIHTNIAHERLLQNVSSTLAEA